MKRIIKGFKEPWEDFLLLFRQKFDWIYLGQALGIISIIATVSGFFLVLGGAVIWALA